MLDGYFPRVLGFFNPGGTSTLPVLALPDLAPSPSCLSWHLPAGLCWGKALYEGILLNAPFAPVFVQRLQVRGWVGGAPV